MVIRTKQREAAKEADASGDGGRRSLKALATATVRDGPSLTAQTIGELTVGAIVQVLEEQEHDGHSRVRIASEPEGAWCTYSVQYVYITKATASLHLILGLNGAYIFPGVGSRVLPSGRTLLGPSDFKAEEPFLSKHIVVVYDEPVKYRVVATCTIRDGCNLDTADKVGQYETGAVVDVLQQVTDWTGVKLFQTENGWVKQ